MSKLLSVALLLLLAVLTGGCSLDKFDETFLDPFELGEHVLGDDAKDGGGLGTKDDQAFLQAMAAQQALAIGLGNADVGHSQIGDIKSIAQSNITTQTAQTAQMQDIWIRLFAGQLEPDAGKASNLGLTATDAGLDVNPEAVEGSQTPDRDFIDAMIHSHQGAIRLARAVLVNSQDVELRILANTIISTDTDEITQLNTIRQTNFGASSPSGGVPQ